MKFSIQLSLFLRSFFLQAGWNYMKYQNLGLTFTMLPFLKNEYKNDKDALPSVLQRYLENFNTHPVMASFCLGALAKQEEQIAHAQSLSDFKSKINEWNGIHRSLSITTASIGDRLFWGTLKPLTLLLALFIWLALGVNFFELENGIKIPFLCFWCRYGGLCNFQRSSPVCEMARFKNQLYCQGKFLFWSDAV